MNILRISFGLHGDVLEWIRSFLHGRVQVVRVGSSKSDPADLRYGVPQGSVLGPLLYIIYTADIVRIFERHGFRVHLYADDSQLYIHLTLHDIGMILGSVESCLTDVLQFSSSRRLLLNAGKTEFMILDRSGVVQSLPDKPSICFNGARIEMVDTARSLGVTMDSRISMKAFITRTSRTCFFHMRRIRQIRSCLTEDSARTITVALVMSRLDYCNAILAGLPAASLGPLCSALHAAARAVTGVPPRCHITPVLRELHWLPIQARIQYKLCLLMFGVQSGNSPDYLKEMVVACSSVQSRRSLRSASSAQFIVPRTRLKFGDRSFAVAGPVAWNSLPLAVRTLTSRPTFKRALKTFLFGRFL